MTENPQVRSIPYRAISTYLPLPIDRPTLDLLLSAIEEEKKDGLVKIMISEREVATLRVESRRIYINEIVDNTPQETEKLRKYPVYDRIALRALMEKYVDTITGDSIEDLDFLDAVKNDSGKRKADGQRFILLLWDRYWDVLSRFKGDSSDGIYIISERDVWDEGDRNTFNL
ncbi:MAG: hypothetical protein ACP5UO_05710 [Thermoplasmata archaeon]